MSRNEIVRYALYNFWLETQRVPDVRAMLLIAMGQEDVGEETHEKPRMAFTVQGFSY